MSTTSVVFGLVVSGLILIVWTPTFVRDIAKQSVSAGWPSVSSKVIQSETYSRKLFSTGLRFRHRFVVNGRQYESQARRAVGLSLYYIFDSKEAFAAQHPVGSTVTVYYDPAQPERVTLSTGVSPLDFLFAVPAVPALGIVVYRSGAELVRRARVRATAIS